MNYKFLFKNFYVPGDTSPRRLPKNLWVKSSVEPQRGCKPEK